MNNRYCFLVSVMALCALTAFGFWEKASAQRTMIVEPGPLPPEVGLLNRVIEGDTTETGDRVDRNTVYVLRRDSFYLLDDSFRNGFPLTIVAEEGTGERPFVGPGFVDGASARPFRPADNLTLRGLKVSNEDNTGGVNTNMIRVDGDNLKIVIDDCHLDKDGQAMFRLDGEGNSVWLINSIVSNSNNFDSPGNGRCIDTRGNDSDSLIIENCTIYNLSNAVLRSAGASINYARLNHNTMVNIGASVDFGKTQTAIYTNNLFINGDFYGAPPGPVDHLVNLDSLDVAPEMQTADIRNNNFYTSPQVLAAQPDTITAGVIFSTTAQLLVDAAGTGNTMIEEAITFTNGPPDPVNVITTSYDPNVTNEGFDLSGEPYDFAYSNSATSYTGSTAGQPLGALTWFDMDIINSVSAPGGMGTPETFSLLSNYPNPFNPVTNIVYNLPSSAVVNLTIFNLAGQKVRELVSNQQQGAGEYQVHWNGADEFGKSVAGGLYLYRIEAGNFSQTNKMTLLK